MRKRQYLIPVQKQRRLDTSTILIRNLKAGTAERVIDFCSDKILFTIEACVNNENKRMYAKYSTVIDESVRTVYHRQKTFSLMVWDPFSKI